jgi:hypothetical protein
MSLAVKISPFQGFASSGRFKTEPGRGSGPGTPAVCDPGRQILVNAPKSVLVENKIVPNVHGHRETKCFCLYRAYIY